LSFVLRWKERNGILDLQLGRPLNNMATHSGLVLFTAQIKVDQPMFGCPNICAKVRHPSCVGVRCEVWRVLK